MDDNIIYYLVLGAIYLVSRLLKKKKPVKPIVPQPSVDSYDDYEQPIPQQSAPQKPTSFEDLLKEISQEFTDRNEPKPQIKAIEEPELVVEPVPKKELTREAKYVKKRHKELAEEEEQRKVKRLMEQEEEHEPHAVLELLQEDGGAANAIILSEILTKKY